MDRQNIDFPWLEAPFNTAKKAPSILIGLLFAALSDIVTGCSTAFVNPALRKASRDHKLDWAQESATQSTRNVLEGCQLIFEDWP